MADNYLEKRMEEHLRRSSSISPKTRRTPLPDGKVVVDYNIGRVCIDDGCTPLGEALVLAFRKMGCRVSFTGTDGRKIAEHTGAEYHPGVDIETMLKRLTARGDNNLTVIRHKNGVLTVSKPHNSDFMEIKIDSQASSGDMAALAVFAASPHGNALRYLSNL